MVMARITPRQFKVSRLPDRDLPAPDVNVDPLCSNIYSVSERVVLAWMNHLFTSYKDRIWHRNSKGLLTVAHSTAQLKIGNVGLNDKYTRIHQNTPEHTRIHQNTPVYVRIHQNTPDYTSIRQTVHWGHQKLTRKFSG